MVPKPGYDAGIAVANPAERLHWVLKGAPMRKKDLKLTALEAVAAGQRLRREMTAKMVKQKLLPEDAHISTVFAAPDLSSWNTDLLNIPAHGDVDLADVKKFQGALPIGYLIAVWDKKAGGVYVVKRPLIVEDPRALAFCEAACRALAMYLQRTMRPTN